MLVASGLPDVVFLLHKVCQQYHAWFDLFVDQFNTQGVIDVRMGKLEII
jgi:hypothetical protein